MDNIAETKRGGTQEPGLRCRRTSSKCSSILLDLYKCLCSTLSQVDPDEQLLPVEVAALWRL